MQLLSGIFLGFSDLAKAPEPLGRPRLLRRIDGAAREVHWVRLRDHYVDVVTDQGTTSLLPRFKDALDELEGVAGLRVHRSQWVARAAIAAVGREGARLFLRLTCGSRVPVSRRYRADLECEGLI